MRIQNNVRLLRELFDSLPTADTEFIVSALRGNDNACECDYKLITTAIRHYVHYKYGICKLRRWSAITCIELIAQIRNKRKCSHYEAHLLDAVDVLGKPFMYWLRRKAKPL